MALSATLSVQIALSSDTANNDSNSHSLTSGSTLSSSIKDRYAYSTAFFAAGLITGVAGQLLLSSPAVRAALLINSKNEAAKADSLIAASTTTNTTSVNPGGAAPAGPASPTPNTGPDLSVEPELSDLFIDSTVAILAYLGLIEIIVAVLLVGAGLIGSCTGAAALLLALTTATALLFGILWATAERVRSKRTGVLKRIATAASSSNGNS